MLHIDFHACAPLSERGTGAFFFADLQNSNVKRLARLRDGLAHNDAEAVPAEVKSLLGLGIGLTPSADDVLCGMTYTLLHGARKLTAADTMN